MKTITTLILLLAILSAGNLAHAAPVVVATNPVNGAQHVYVGMSATVTFSVPVDASTINAASFVLKQNDDMGHVILARITYVEPTAIFTPLNNLEADTWHTCIITTEVKDHAGEPLKVDHVWLFKTGGLPPLTHE